MKAIVLEAFGSAKNFKLKEVPLPEPGEREVRIKVKAVGFNPVDFKIREGIIGGAVPRILGSDCSGIIDSIGPNVTELSIGDEVFAMSYGKSSNGSYAEFLSLPVDFVVKKPKNLSFEEAASVPLTSMTAYRTMIASNAINKGDTIFIAGAGGGVGSFAVQLAQWVGVKAIFTIALSEESAKFMEKNQGIDPNHILIYKGLSIEELEKQLIAMNKGNYFNATFDYVGQDIKHLCINLLNFSGHFSTILPEMDDFTFPVWSARNSPFFKRNLSIHMVNVGAESHSHLSETWGIYSKHLGYISDLFNKNLLSPPVIKVVGDLSEKTVQEAHDLLEKGRTKGKLVMKLGN